MAPGFRHWLKNVKADWNGHEYAKVNGHHIEIPTLTKDRRNALIESSSDKVSVGVNHLASASMAGIAFVALTSGVDELAFTAWLSYGLIAAASQTAIRFVWNHYEYWNARNKNLNKVSKTIVTTALLPLYILASIAVLAGNFVGSAAFVAIAPFIAFSVSLFNCFRHTIYAIHNSFMWYKTPKERPYARERYRTQAIKRIAQATAAAFVTITIGLLGLASYTVASPAVLAIAITAGVVNTAVFLYSGLREFYPAFFRHRKGFIKGRGFAEDLVNKDEDPNRKTQESNYELRLRNESLEDKDTRFTKEYPDKNNQDPACAKFRGLHHHHQDLIAEIEGIAYNIHEETDDASTSEEKIKAKIAAINSFLKKIIDNKKTEITDDLKQRETLKDTPLARAGHFFNRLFGIKGHSAQQIDKRDFLEHLPYLVDPLNSKDADKTYTNLNNPFKSVNRFTGYQIILAQECPDQNNRKPNTIYIYQDGTALKYCMDGIEPTILSGGNRTNVLSFKMEKMLKGRLLKEKTRVYDPECIKDILQITSNNKHTTSDDLETFYEKNPEKERNTVKAFINKFSELEEITKAARVARQEIERLNALLLKQKQEQEPPITPDIIDNNINATNKVWINCATPPLNDAQNNSSSPSNITYNHSQHFKQKKTTNTNDTNVSFVFPIVSFNSNNSTE